MTAPGPAADLIDHAAGIIVEKMREPHTAPYHWAGALWEAGMLCAPGTAPDPTRPVRIVTTDPGRQCGCADADRTYAEMTQHYSRTVGRLERDLAEEKAAHAKTRQNFAEHVGAEFPVELEAVRVGLDVDQEIRYRAAHLWLEDGNPPTDWKLGDWVAWIGTGASPMRRRSSDG